MAKLTNTSKMTPSSAPAQRLRPVDAAQNDWEPVAADDPRPLVPPGKYQLLCTGAVHRTYSVFHRDAIVLKLQIVCDDQFIGTCVERFYNVPPNKKIPRGSDYFREWVLANGGVKPLRRERMPKKKFIGKVFWATVTTVATDRRGIDLGAARYSKVARLIELAATNEPMRSP